MTVKKFTLLNFIMVLSVSTFCSCDENTSTLGLFPEADGITSTYEVFQVHTRSIAMDSVLSTSTNNFIGSITDPETNTRITASFAAQFHSFESFSFPNRQQLFPIDPRLEIQPDHSKDPIGCDSIDVRLYFNDYYGEKNNPMKMEVYELDPHNTMSEDSTYYTNINLEQFLPSGAKPIATKMFTPEDYTLSDAERTSSKHIPNIHISLPKEYGTRIMNSYYEHPEYFADSYSFIHNVCPGLYFRLKSGNGTMVSVTVGTMNIHYKFFDSENADSVYAGWTRFAATPEVIQSTQFENQDVSELVNDETCTYLKTPAGICTEITLPVREIYATHSTDSVNKAQLTLTRYNRAQVEHQLGIPSSLLLVRKQNMYSFFEKHEVSDSQTSYTTTFNSTYNSYTFENLSRLISYCQHEKIYGMKQENLTETQWEAKHPDWNKVVVIPVNTSTNTSGYEVSVTHDISMNSIRLVGGSRTPINMQVIYSRFQ